ncbi:MAG TPA: aldose 1-epimerase [Firmicutes bacterium]|nr:aldose 1-epimerase [Bacillota bacterium]
MSYGVVTENWSDQEVFVLSGPDGAKATILPWGANLIQLALPVGRADTAVELLSAPEDFKALEENPTRYGCPILYPFPSRISAGRFTFAGQEFQVDVYPDGNARHGFVHNRMFTAAGLGSGPDGAWVTLVFDGNIADIQRQFPFPFELTITYRLAEAELAVDVTARNAGGRQMPMGFGWHPYFNMPLLPDGDREQCQLQVPTSTYWELADDLVPTGRRLPVSGRLDLRSGYSVGETMYDDILSGVESDENHWSHASLLDQEAKLKATVSAGPSFREWVIYTPPQRAAVCLEPYTCVGNAFNLHAAGVDAGVIVLAPGESWSDTMKVTLSHL